MAPFIGTYGYDEFDNLSSRWGRYALNPNTTDSGTYVNNKRTNTGWSYDPDGRVLTSTDTATSTTQSWTYDAAGNQTGISEVSSGTTTVNTLSYDGDGDLLYESVSTPQTTKADYLIRSRVLGTVLTKLDAAGNKDITYVPANGLAAPMQTKDSNGNPIIRWVYRDVTGLQEDGKAYDPFGALIQNVQPPSGGPPPTQPFYGATYGGVSWNSFIDANNLSSGCRLDGVRTSCTSVLNQLGHGNADLVSLSTTGTLADFLNTVGTIPRSVTHSRYVPNTNPPPDHSNDPDRADVIVTNIDEQLPGHWEYWEEYVAFSPDPQKTLPLPSDLEGRVTSIITNPKGDCADYIKKLLSEVASHYGQAFSDDPIVLFNRVQGEAGFRLKKTKYAGLAGFKGNSRGVYLKPMKLSGTESDHVIEHTKNGYAVTALNELMHHARKSGVYTDRMLAEAAYNLLSP